MNDGRLRQLYRDAFQANPSPDLNLQSWVLLRRAYVRAVLRSIPQVVFQVEPFAPAPSYAVPEAVDAARELLDDIDRALVEAGVLRFRPKPLESAYYRTHYARPPEGIDLDAWVGQERARLQSASARVQPNGPGIGGYNVGVMEGWSPADKLADFDREIAALDRAVIEEAELRNLEARSVCPPT